jgi:hypothetical protein
MSRRATQNVGLRAPEGLTPEQISRLNAQGLDVVDGRFVPFEFTQQIARDEEARLPTDIDTVAPVTPAERVEDARFDASIERFKALQARRQRLEEVKAVAAGEQLDIIVGAEQAIDRAIGAQAEALNNYQRGKDANIDEATMAVLSRNVDSSSALADEALAIAAEAQANLDRVLATELPEDTEAREVRAEVRDAEAVPPGRVGAEDYGDLPLDKPLDRRALKKVPEAPAQKSMKQRDTEAKGQAYIEALRLVKEDDGKGFQSLLGTPLGIEVADLYQANKAKGDQTNEQLLSYLAREFPRSEDQQKAAQVVFGLDIAEIESEYMGKEEESPLRPLYQQAGIELDAGSTVEEPDDPIIAPEVQEDE